MDDDLEILFGISNTLKDREHQRLLVDDLTSLAKSLEHCSSKKWDELARYHFNLTTADIENINNDYQSRSSKIYHMVLKWYEKDQNQTTLHEMAEILDQADLSLIKQLWWLEYKDEEIASKVKDFQKERRSSLMKSFVNFTVTDENRTKLFLELQMHDKENLVMKLHPSNPTKQLQELFDWWTEKFGYIKASKHRLTEALKSVGMTKEACVLTGLEHDPEATSNVMLPGTSSRLEDASNVGQTFSTTSSGLENIPYAFGIQNSEEDLDIGKRLQCSLKEMGFSVCLFQDYVSPQGAGVTKVDKHTAFCDDCVCIVWVATPASVKCERYDEFHITNAFHRAIEEKRKNFIIFFPKEHLDPEPTLPPALKAYDPLQENADFERCLKATYERIKKKRQSLKR